MPIFHVYQLLQEQDAHLSAIPEGWQLRGASGGSGDSSRKGAAVVR